MASLYYKRFLQSVANRTLIRLYTVASRAISSKSLKSTVAQSCLLSVERRLNLTTAPFARPLHSTTTRHGKCCHPLQCDAATSPDPKKVGKVTVTLVTNWQNITLQGNEGDSILDLVNDNNVDIFGFGSCEGTLACSTCHLILAAKDYDVISKGVSDEEQDVLNMADNATDTSRLGCRVYLCKDMDGMTIYVPSILEFGQK